VTVSLQIFTLIVLVVALGAGAVSQVGDQLALCWSFACAMLFKEVESTAWRQ